MTVRLDLAGGWLMELWRDMRNDAGMQRRAYVHGAIAMAAHVGALDADHAELWRRRVQTCPGHDDEGGRAWCAYCGEMGDCPHGKETREACDVCSCRGVWEGADEEPESEDVARAMASELEIDPCDEHGEPYCECDK